MADRTYTEQTYIIRRPTLGIAGWLPMLLTGAIVGLGLSLTGRIDIFACVTSGLFVVVVFYALAALATVERTGWQRCPTCFGSGAVRANPEGEVPDGT